MGQRGVVIAVGWSLALTACSRGASGLDTSTVSFGPGTATPSEDSSGDLDSGGLDDETTAAETSSGSESSGDAPPPMDTTGEPPPPPDDPVCGDGVVNGSETCDDGNANDVDACLSDCTPASCGDGIVQQGVELCDDGNASDVDDCTSTCTLASCGDGVLQNGELCDDGNASNTDGCLATCVTASCGDGFVRAGVEACDDGNASNTDACLTECVAASCGDGFVYAGVEECDGAGDPMVYSCSLECQDQLVWYQWSFSYGYWPNPMACSDFNMWRAALADDHTSIHIAGTFDVPGRTCTGPAATTLCNTLRDGGSVTTDCDGSTWHVGNNCAGAMEVTVDGTNCSCAYPGVALRPCVSLVDWGGVSTSTCSGPTQDIYIECGFD
jgi:cysteine-rich repeat protein